jgi:hypothetical protein
MDPSKRFVTAVLALGVAVLLGAIALGERMGEGVLTQAVDNGVSAQTPLVTPLPESTATGAYGPDWKSNQALAAAPDPHFPDPRIPPKPLPTLATPTPSPRPKPTWTPNANLNVPVWDQTPPPPASPTASPTDEPGDTTTVASPEPTATP